MNASEWFADTGYWLAWLNREDDLHGRAHRFDTLLPPSLVTTEAVLFEVGNAMARPPLRARAMAFFERIRANPRIVILPVDSALFRRAVAFYAARPDKDWGLVDCASFVVMQDRGITQALAYDQHFTQAGLRALLRE
ncbi:MAG: type II toxin-antitoxin system VapC family toxin [Dehalococcoidia bacterium]